MRPAPLGTFVKSPNDGIAPVEPGLLGDLVAVKGNPLDDISILENIEAVVKGGLVFKVPTEKMP